MRQINVIDMYHGNAVKTSDFAALRASGVFGIVHKASQGLSYKDPSYHDRRKAAEDAGMLWGAYHFLDASDPKAQAAFFLECSGISDAGSAPFLLSADYENSAHSPALHQLTTFISEVDRNSPPPVSCVLYSGNLIRENLKPHVGGHQNADMLSTMQFYQQHRLWLAEYGPHMRIPYPWNEPITKSSDQSQDLPAPGVWLWQFTEKGRVNPLVGNTDGNFFDGTFEQLQRSWVA